MNAVYQILAGPFLKRDEICAVPRPGVFYGAYPLKAHVKNSFVDFITQRIKKTCREVSGAGYNKYQSMLNRVNANHKIVHKMTDTELDKWIINIRQKLHSRGLKDELICRAFATIKEVAYREINMSHYDCQLQGGWIMMQGMIAEMQTGEGKTLTATLPAGSAAMAGIPVHVLTVNDYLVQRDAELMRPVYERLGLTVAYIVEGMSEQERQQAYRSDITYCTAKQLVFDYLRDRMLLKQFNTELDFKLSSLYSRSPVRDQLLLRGLSFAVVDEADSIFIDEARTPLILSSKTNNKQQEELHREAIWLARQLNSRTYYTIDDKIKQATLTEQGVDYLKQLTADMSSIWQGENRSRSLVQQALSALHCYQKDIHYFIDQGKVQIIDDNTGRSMPDRAWEAGLHQMIEEKEACQQTGQNQTIARTSYQRFFSRFLKLSGMTGTGLEVSNELLSTYGLSVVPVDTHKPCQRHHYKTEIFYTYKDKCQAVVDEALSQKALNRPVLIGTRTVKESEYISDLLTASQCEHQVLNAKQHKQEAEIIARAGGAAQVTVATNMAGRGTDIILDNIASEAGGLHVICCGKNDSRRIDRQLVGRSARQGDPGSYSYICSLEDDAVTRYFSKITRILLNYKQKTALSGRVRFQLLALVLVNLSQRMVEFYHGQIRKSMMKIDEQRDSMLAFTRESE